MLSDFDMLTNLNTVANLQLHEKICTTGKTFTVCSRYQVFAGLFRSWYGEERSSNISRITALVSLAMLRCQVLELRKEDESLRRRILQCLGDAMAGVENMAQTYQGDAAALSTLNVLREDVRLFLQQRSECASP